MKDYLPVIGWSLIILVLSTRASISLPESWMDLIAIDKFGHAFVYGVQTFLLLKVFREQTLARPILWALIISISYGISMEIIQYTFFPNRFFEVFDIIANISGSLLGLFIFKKLF